MWGTILSFIESSRTQTHQWFAHKLRACNRLDPYLVLVGYGLETLLEEPCQQTLAIHERPGASILVFSHEGLTEANISLMGRQGLVVANNLIRSRVPKGVYWHLKPAAMLLAAGVTDILFTNWIGLGGEPPEQPSEWVFRRYHITRDSELELVRESRAHQDWRRAPQEFVSSHTTGRTRAPFSH